MLVWLLQVLCVGLVVTGFVGWFLMLQVLCVGLVVTGGVCWFGCYRWYVMFVTGSM